MPVKKKKAKRLKPSLKYHGGKTYLALGIIELMRSHLHYVEPYFGGGAVLLARDPNRDWYEGADDWTGEAAQRGCSEVVNDINGELTNFWRVLQRDVTFQKFLRHVQAMPFSEKEWRDACESQDGKTGLTTEEREELRRLRKELRVVKMERDILGKAVAFFAKENQ